MRVKLLLALLSLASSVAFSQTGTNPPSVKWRQINTESFKIIFPAELEQEGQRMANTMQYIHKPLSGSLGHAPHKIPLVLQNQGVISNGFVALSPRRSEFYTTAPQNYNLSGTNNWLNLLAMHEFRHMVQYEKAYHSRVKLAYYPFGQNGILALSNAAVPSWFWEGDAVATETAFSPSGRGRIPDFDLLFRTILLERKPYRYNKQHLGSFRDNVPNHYVTGYHLVTHLRRKAGTDIWGKVMQQALDQFYVPFTFSRAIRQQAGKRLTATYRAMTHELDSLWTQQADSLPQTPAIVLTQRRNRTYTDYLYPQPLSDGGFIALKSGLSDIQTFVRLDADGRNERKIFTPGILTSNGMLSVVDEKIVWSEYEYDPRWDTRNYSIIKTYDLETGTYQVLKRQTRLAAPAFSPNAHTIAAIEVSTQNINSLVLLDADTGEELKRWPSPQNDFISMPRWAPDGKSVVLLRTRNNTRTIVQVDVETGTFTDLMPPTSENIGHPVITDKYVFYNSPYNGIENIYALDLITRQQYQVASRRYAGINPAVTTNGKGILFNDFSLRGYNVYTMSLNPDNWIPLAKVVKSKVNYYGPLVEQEGTPNILTNVPAKTYPVQKYSRLKHIFNPHSWMPSLDPEGNSVSLAILSQDILSTAVSTVGYTRNLSESSNRVFAGVSYLGYYPVINLTGATGYRTTQENDTTYQWREKNITAGLALPLNLTRSKYLQSLTLSTNAQINSISDFYRPRRVLTEQANGVLRNVNYSASYNRVLRQSRRDLAGRFEQRASLYYNHTPFGGDYSGEIFTATTRLAFPGLLKHHSLQLTGNYQKEDTHDYIFSSPMRFVRGYGYRPHDEFYGGSVQYKFPIFYPDFALGPFFYFQRLKSNIFYDYGYGQRYDRRNQVNRNYTYQSVGLELTTDFNFMRLQGVLFDAGVRVLYRPDTQKPSIEFIVGEFNL
ncbi:hypothetical protein AAE02nite_19490 [Adhaeribacter aerolatus]|uniref:Uncharacterized protein n=1 Tax=Adhaeribacter aerolatus TaxID=670289 RepID=A0A512AX35_9BACT|nr:hypothetical protein [Adhaeribacter aerolatus]GEO04285.1 hypothetical protein AAE02nite_19490 [Adhaeribacter aerolatus]